MKRIITVISVLEACEILKSYGWSVTPKHLYAGIACGAYPFGVAIPMPKQTAYEIYKPLLMKWIDERSEETDDTV